MIVNLCVNARAAMPDGGTILISTSQCRFDADFCAQHSWCRPGDFVCLSVRDEGSGMNEQVLQHVFEPFFTTKPVGEGTGLGMAVVYGIVKSHQALIDIESESGKGTEVRVYFPAVPSPPATRSEPAATSAEVLGSETILVAEDEAVLRTLAARVLEKAGFSVVLCNDGEEALRAYRERPDEIALMLVDAVMPKLGGRGLFHAVRAQDPAMPVIFASGYSRDTLDESIHEAELVEFIEKPYRTEELLNLVRTMLDAARDRRP
jgi:signal transduction histidine kinase